MAGWPSLLLQLTPTFAQNVSKPSEVLALLWTYLHHKETFSPLCCYVFVFVFVFSLLIFLFLVIFPPNLGAQLITCD